MRLSVENRSFHSFQVKKKAEKLSKLGFIYNVYPCIEIIEIQSMVGIVCRYKEK